MSPPWKEKDWHAKGVFQEKEEEETKMNEMLLFFFNLALEKVSSLIISYSPPIATAPSIHPSTYHLLIHPPTTFSSIHPPTHPSIHPLFNPIY